MRSYFTTYTELTNYVNLVSPKNLTVSFTESLKHGMWKRSEFKRQERQIWNRSNTWRINYKDKNFDVQNIIAHNSG